MLAESYNDVRSGRLDQGIQLPSTAKLELMDFIAHELPRWRDHADRPTEHAETKLTEHLCDHLNSATYRSVDWSHVQFRTETSDEVQAGRKIDLTVKPRGAALIIEGRRHSQFDALFPIECKRLPTPKVKGRDEREYVTTDSGTTGGMQRFKFGYHGASHAFAAMIAYVQEGTFAHWLGQVNGWIHGLSTHAESEWTDQDVLEMLEDNPVAGLCTLKSHHSRRGGLSDCALRHVWVAMQGKSATG